MAPSPKRFSLKAPAPRAVLLPDPLFFVRVIPVSEGATAADVNAQVELALESLAPFPLAQLYYAHHWVRGAKSAVVYAAYRKRFTPEQTDSWSDAEIVLPTFAALLTAKVEPATAIVLTTEDSVTVLHWSGEAGVPTSVITRTFLPEMSVGEKRAVREEILRSVGGTRSVIELDSAPVIEGTGGSNEFLFRAGNIEAPHSREHLDVLDIRDKGDVAGRRRARARDLLLWRLFLACVLGVVLAGLLEVGIIGGRIWQRSRQAIVERQAAPVAEIQRAQTLATRIEELSTKRLRPMEMIRFLAEKKPKSVLFSRATSTGTFSIEIEAKTNVPADVSTYQGVLRQLTQLSKVDVQVQSTRDGSTVFRVLTTFKPDAFTAPSAAPAPAPAQAPAPTP